MNCTNCGAQNLDGAKFCAGCGAPLATAEQPVYQQPAYQPQQPYGYDPNQQPQYETYPQQPQQPKKPLNYKLIGIIAGVAALALILFLVFGGGHSNSPEGVAEAFMEAAAENDVDAVKDLLYGEMKEDAYDYCSGSEMELEGLEMNITDFKVLSTEEISDEDELDRIAERYDLEVEIEEAQELIADVTVEMSFMGQEQKRTNEAEFLLICIDGDWYVAKMG